MDKIVIKVESSCDNMRLDKFLADNADGFSRESLKVLFDEKSVLVNGTPQKASFRVKEGFVVEASLPDTKQLDVTAEDIPINIVYEDDDIAIVDKAEGMVVHPANGNPSGTLVNALMYHLDHLSAINGIIRPGIVHRIDKETSGLLVIAKNDEAHNKLSEQFAVHSITRGYSAIVHGIIPSDKGVIDAPIGRNPLDRKAFCVTAQNSKRAVTHYEVVNRYDDYTHINLTLETGRTHQIRVHMKYISHPIVGDKLYGYDRAIDKQFTGQLLHAYLLGFIHPRTGEYVEFQSELPKRFDWLVK